MLSRSNISLIIHIGALFKTDSLKFLIVNLLKNNPVAKNAIDFANIARIQVKSALEDRFKIFIFARDCKGRQSSEDM